MARQIIWGILPDENEQPRIEFGEDTSTKQAYLSINGQDVGTGSSGNANLQVGKGTAAIQQLPDGVSGGFTSGNAKAKEYVTALTGVIPYGGTGVYSASFGGKSNAYGKRSFSEGNCTIARGPFSHAEGNEAVAIGRESHAEGFTTTAVGTSAHAEGHRTLAFGEYSHAEGVDTVADFTAAHAEGINTRAEGDSAHAGGAYSTAHGYASFAHGLGVQTVDDQQFAIGVCNAGMWDTLLEVGSGTYNEAEPNKSVRKNAFMVMRDGRAKVENGWVQEDDDVVAKSTMDRAFDALNIKNGLDEDTIRQKYGYAAAKNAAAFNDGLAFGTNSFAMGSGRTEGHASVAAGLFAWAKHFNSYALGFGTQTGDNYQLVVGTANIGRSGTSFEIGNGTVAFEKLITRPSYEQILQEQYFFAKDNDPSTNDFRRINPSRYSKWNYEEGDYKDYDVYQMIATRKNAFEVYSDARVVAGSKLEHLQDQESGVTVGKFKFTDKNKNATKEDSSLTGEIDYGAKGAFSTALGGKCTAIGKRAFACGTTTIAKGDYSFAEGNSSVTLGSNAHAEGTATLAKGSNSHAEGSNTQALGNISHAEGNASTAGGSASHAQGTSCKANGNYSHAGGRSSEVTSSSEGGFAHGWGLYINQNYQTAFGTYNEVNENVVFAVGNGTDANHRSNVFAVDKSGDIGIYKNGKIYSLHKMLASYFTDTNLR